MIPEYLFHYTNINTLASILKTRKTRFSRLDTVNDTTEGESSDYGTFSQYMFVSCWTELKEESLSFWNMYTSNMKGVRLKLKFPIVKTFENNVIFDKNNSIFSDHFLLPNLEPITKVEYTDDDDKLYPKIMAQGGLELSKLGKYKAKVWSIETEWRYIVNIIPLRDDIIDDDIRVRAWPLMQQRTPHKFKFYDFQMDINSFENMEITIGPKCDFGDKIIIESLVNSFNPSAKIIDSSLTGKLR